MENTFTFDDLNEIDSIDAYCSELEYIENLEREIEQEDNSYELEH